MSLLAGIGARADMPNDGNQPWYSGDIAYSAMAIVDGREQLAIACYGNVGLFDAPRVVGKFALHLVTLTPKNVRPEIDDRAFFMRS